MEMMRNPNAMREAMRNQDLAMSQLENLPGGFNAMRRMFEEVHEPMMEATQSLNTNNNNGASNNAASNASTNPNSTVPTSSAVPNPWGGSPAQTNSPAQPGAAANPFANPFGMSPFGAGMGGMGGLGGLGGTDPAAAARMMQDPFMQQMMAQMLNDPNMIQQVHLLFPLSTSD